MCLTLCRVVERCQMRWVNLGFIGVELPALNPDLFQVSVNSAISACAQGSRWMQVRLPRMERLDFGRLMMTNKKGGCWKPGNPILG